MGTEGMPDSPNLDDPASGSRTLAALRAELDGLDDAVHDLLMRRAEVVERVGHLGAKGRVALRPGREAAIIRRLLGRHHGGLPRGAVVRIWRELLGATTGMQGTHAVAVCETGPGNEYVQCAREHFGALTPLLVDRSAAQAISDVSEGRVTAAVLPLPTEDEPVAWWTTLPHRGDPRIHVVARLPFWGAPGVQALVVTAIPPDPSGRDRSLIALELPAGMSRARLGGLLAQAGFAGRDTLLRREVQTRALVEVEGLVGDDDPRLASLGEMSPVVLGGYAIPLEGDGV